MSISDDRDDALQFDSVIPPPLPGGAAAGSTGVTCVACRTGIHDDYYDVNGQTVCGTCRARLLEHAEPPRDWGTFARATLYGLGAAVAGALLYYAVVAITNFEIGIVALAIGYMVGYSVRAGARGRGGRRLQVLAVALTYLAVGLAYGVLAVGTALEASRRSPTSATAGADTAAHPEANAARATQDATDGNRSGGSGLAPLASLAVVVLALPVIVVLGSLPGGLLSGAIIVFGMLQAWRLTGAPDLRVSGPYRVGAAPAP